MIHVKDRIAVYRNSYFTGPPTMQERAHQKRAIAKVLSVSLSGDSFYVKFEDGSGTDWVAAKQCRKLKPPRKPFEAKVIGWKYMDGNVWVRLSATDPHDDGRFQAGMILREKKGTKR